MYSIRKNKVDKSTVTVSKGTVTVRQRYGTLEVLQRYLYGTSAVPVLWRYPTVLRHCTLHMNIQYNR